MPRGVDVHYRDLHRFYTWCAAHNLQFVEDGVPQLLLMEDRGHDEDRIFTYKFKNPRLEMLAKLMFHAS